MAGVIGDLNFRIGADTSKFKKALDLTKQTLKQVDNLGKRTSVNVGKNMNDVAKATGKTVNQVRSEMMKLAHTYDKMTGMGMSDAISKAKGSLGIDYKKVDFDDDTLKKLKSGGIEGLSGKFSALSTVLGESGYSGLAGKLSGVSSALSKVGAVASKAGPYIAAITEALKVLGKIAKPIIKAYLKVFTTIAKTTGSIALQIGESLVNGLISPLKKGRDRLVNPFGKSFGNKFGYLIGGGIAAGISYKLKNFIKDTISGGGDFEQMTQGIQILFADTRTSTENNLEAISAASDKMRQNALMAYKNVGMNATEYMNMASSFATRITSELEGDTNKAADVINIAMQDMADNWHLLGGDFELIKNAYESLLRGNYRTFDNLKLGYGQTKTEVERLLADAEKLSGVHYDIDNLSDIMLAIHEIQKATGMTGTTAREALTTWAGATNMLKNAWINFKDTVGQGLIWLLRPVLAVIAKISDALVAVGIKFMTWAQKITGIKDMVVGKKNDKDYSSAATGIGGINDAIDGTGGSAGKAKKAIKDLKRELMGFDQINKLSGEKGTDTGSGTTGSSGTGGGVDLDDLVDQSWMNRLVESAGEDVETIYEKYLKEAWEKADFTGLGEIVARKIADVLDKINWTRIKEVCGKIGKSFATFLNGVFATDELWHELGETVGNAINSIVEIAYQFVSNFKWADFGKALAIGINDAVIKIDAVKIGKLISERIKGALDFAAALIGNIDFKTIGDKIAALLSNIDFPAIKEKAGKLGETIATALNDVLANNRLWNEAGESFGESINSIINFGYKAVKKFDWKQLGLDIAAFINNTFREMDGEKLGKTIFETINGIFDTLLTLMDSIEWDTVYAKVEEVVTAIDWGTLFEKAFTLTDETIDKLWNIGKLIFKEIWNGLWDGWEQGWRKKSIDPKINGSLKVKVEPDEQSEKLTWDDIKTWWKGVGTNLDKDPKTVKLKENNVSLNETWTKIKTWWKNAGTNLDNDPKQVKVKENKVSLSQTWENIKSWWKNRDLSEKKPKVKVDLPTWSGVRDKWNNLMSKFKEKKVKIGLDLAAKWSGAKEWINRNVADRVNAIIPKSLKKLGLRFPYLAEGGFVKANTPQLAMIGDNRHEGEIVAPESKLAAMAAQAAQAAAGSGNDEIVALLRQLITLVASKDNNIYLDGEAIKNNTVRRINNHTRSTGQLEILI